MIEMRNRRIGIGKIGRGIGMVSARGRGNIEVVGVTMMIIRVRMMRRGRLLRMGGGRVVGVVRLAMRSI